jgi:hypothetical protein
MRLASFAFVYMAMYLRLVRCEGMSLTGRWLRGAGSIRSLHEHAHMFEIVLNTITRLATTTEQAKVRLTPTPPPPHPTHTHTKKNTAPSDIICARAVTRCEALLEWQNRCQ